MQTASDYLEGKIVLIDKPLHWTSFQVVNKLRWELRQAFKLKKIKVGHAGTLDPLATGLLVICTGRMTKNIDQYQAQTKEYTGTIVLGSTTPSYDLETEVDHHFPTSHINDELLKETTGQFLGLIQQQPPVYSALKKDGKRLYEFARAGQEIEIPSRQVEIHSFDLTDIRGKEVDFKVVCGKGTYIRSLAHDFGKALNSGAHLSVLRRTKIGEFSVQDASSIEAFIHRLKPKPETGD